MGYHEDRYIDYLGWKDGQIGGDAWQDDFDPGTALRRHLSTEIFVDPLREARKQSLAALAPLMRATEKIVDKPVKRHKLARTEVDVFRLFNIKDTAAALRESNDPMIKQLGKQIYDHCYIMLRPYCEEQSAAIERQKAREEKITLQGATGSVSYRKPKSAIKKRR